MHVIDLTRSTHMLSPSQTAVLESELALTQQRLQELITLARVSVCVRYTDSVMNTAAVCCGISACIHAAVPPGTHYFSMGEHVPAVQANVSKF